MGISTTKLGDRSSVLTIANAMAAHSGNYTCVATNAAGSASYTAAVHVNGIGFEYKWLACLWEPVFSFISKIIAIIRMIALTHWSILVKHSIIVRSEFISKSPKFMYDGLEKTY